MLRRSRSLVGGSGTSPLGPGGYEPRAQGADPGREPEQAVLPITVVHPKAPAALPPAAAQEPSPPARRGPRALVGLLVALLVVLIGAGLVIGATRLHGHELTLAAASAGILVGAAVLYLVCNLEPAYVFTLAIVLTIFAGNWKYMHIPGAASPDRLLFVVGTIVVLSRCYVTGTLPRPRIGFSHAMIALAVLYAAFSAAEYHVLRQKGPLLLLVETFGILPFLSFWLGPVIFRTARERSILLVGLVVMGAYLGLTALIETTGPKSLVFPRYILNPVLGLHYGRARGPFLDAVANGVGLYVGAVACAIAAVKWRRPWRTLAGAICLLCLAGTVMTLERSVWISTAAATLVALLATPRTRRLAVPLVLVAAAVTALTIFAVPGLRSSVSSRLHSRQSVYDRENLTQTAFNMIQARPLFGFGWNQYQAKHLSYVRQNPKRPLTAVQTDLHSAYLTYAVELGLVGGTLWLLTVLFGAGGTALMRAPPELEPWRVGLLAMLVFFLIGESAVPPTVFVNASLWLFAGVVAVIRYPAIPQPELVLEPGGPGATQAVGDGRRRRRRRVRLPLPATAGS